LLSKSVRLEAIKVNLFYISIDIQFIDIEQFNLTALNKNSNRRVKYNSILWKYYTEEEG